MTALPACPMCWRALTAAPARIFGLTAGTLAKGAPADLVLLDEDEPFVLEATSCIPAPATPPSKAANSRAGRTHDLCRRRTAFSPAC